MKPTINRLDIDDVTNVRNLLQLLVQLKVNEAVDPHNTLDNSICDDFCSYCDRHEDYCKCGDYYKYGGRICRDHYDEED